MIGSSRECCKLLNRKEAGMDASISDLFCYLMSRPDTMFYAWVLSGLPMRESRQLPCMGVMLQNRRYVLLVNPDWYATASFTEVLVVIKHEVYHITSEHIPRGLEARAVVFDAEQMQRLETAWPYAIDCAVNTLLQQEDANIRALNCIMPEQFKLPEGKSAEFYLNALMNQIKNREEVRKKLLEELEDAFGQGKKNDQQMEETNDSQPCGTKGTGCDGEDTDDSSPHGDCPGSDQGHPGDNRGMAGEEDEEGGETRGGAAAPAVEGEQEGEGEGKGKGGTGLRKGMLANHKPGMGTENSEDGETSSGGNTDDLLALADELRQLGKNAIERAVTATKGRGTLPGQLQQQIDALLEKPQIPFTHILRSWVISTQKHNPSRSLARLRRRYAGIPELIPFPGVGRDRKFTVVWCIDTSGSMGSPELERGLAELRSLQKADRDIEVIVLEADASVEHEYRLSQPNSKINYDVHGRGGTCFDPALIRAQQLKPDIVFYFTDGYAPAPKHENRVRCPFAWIITPSGKVPDEEWGKVITTKR